MTEGREPICPCTEIGTGKDQHNILTLLKQYEAISVPVEIGTERDEHKKILMLP